jgi:hypothetical protein
MSKRKVSTQLLGAVALANGIADAPRPRIEHKPVPSLEPGEVGYTINSGIMTVFADNGRVTRCVDLRPDEPAL